MVAAGHLLKTRSAPPTHPPRFVLLKTTPGAALASDRFETSVAKKGSAHCRPFRRDTPAAGWPAEYTPRTVAQPGTQTRIAPPLRSPFGRFSGKTSLQGTERPGVVRKIP